MGLTSPLLSLPGTFLGGLVILQPPMSLMLLFEPQCPLLGPHHTCRQEKIGTEFHILGTLMLSQPDLNIDSVTY